MRNFVRTIFAGATVTAGILVLSSPATAAVVLTDVNGPNLTTAIKASTTNTQNDNIVVYGCTQNDGQCSNVTFTANTAVHITDGAGYASISDVLGDAASLLTIVSDPLPNFSAYQFSIALNQAGNILVEYKLAGSLNWVAATFGDINNPFAQAANTNRDYQITATAGESLSALRLTSTSSISLFKQNSINLASVGAVPEPTTWMLMLLGMAGVGFSMRRKEKQTLRVRFA